MKVGMEIRVFWLSLLVCLTSRPPLSLTAEDCESLDLGECERSNYNQRLRCSGSFGPYTPDVRVKSLTFCHFPFGHFDVTNVLMFYPNLESFTLTESNVTYVAGRFPASDTLKVLNFTNLQIEKIRSHVFASLKSLRVLDLRNNRLNHLHPAVITLVNRISQLYLQGNEWNCDKNLDWVLYLNINVVQDLEKLVCYGPNYADKPLKAIAMFVANMRVECPERCECSLRNVVSNLDERGGGLMPIIEVNCSHRGLVNFPEVLPANTTTVLLQGNQIKKVNALINNKLYRDVKDVILDHNQITSIDELEGTYWLAHFRVLGLKGNNLTQVPTYALDNALQKNMNALHIYFGENPWRCDCFFTPGFQDLLMKHQNLMKDSLDVKCSSVEGDKNSLMPIIKLSRSSVCQPPSEPTVQVLDMVNAVLASLIVFILGKLAYDYYNFKKTGQLPWIVTKIP